MFCRIQGSPLNGNWSSRSRAGSCCHFDEISLIQKLCAVQQAWGPYLWLWVLTSGSQSHPPTPDGSLSSPQVPSNLSTHVTETGLTPHFFICPAEASLSMRQRWVCPGQDLVLYLSTWWGGWSFMATQSYHLLHLWIPGLAHLLVFPGFPRWFSGKETTCNGASQVAQC